MGLATSDDAIGVQSRDLKVLVFRQMEVSRELSDDRVE